MKKYITLLITVCILLTSVFCIPVSAAGATMGFSKTTLRAGDTFSVSLNASLSGALTVNGAFSYSGPITLTSITASTGTLDTNGNNIFVDLGNSEINGVKTVAVANFTVNANAAAGQNITVSFSGFFSNLNGDNAISGSGSVSVLAPLSTNNELAALEVKNAKITPAFSVGNLNYTASVPFEISKLDIAAKAVDGKSTVTVNSPNLTPNGTTNVTVTVTAENGAKRVYSIAVKREQDPNYVPSDNNNLSNISVEGFLLSPVFDSKVTDYVVWVPYETESIKIGGTAEDGKASPEVLGGEKLAAGQDNIVKVVCTAENGTKKEYNVVVKRAAGHDGSVDEKPTEPVVDTDVQADDTDKAQNGIAWWWLIVVGIGALIIGAAGGFIVSYILKKNKV